MDNPRTIQPGDYFGQTFVGSVAFGVGDYSVTCCDFVGCDIVMPDTTQPYGKIDFQKCYFDDVRFIAANEASEVDIQHATGYEAVTVSGRGR